MKKFITASLFIIAFLLHGCEPAATFDKAQPDHVKSLASSQNAYRANTSVMIRNR